LNGVSTGAQASLGIVIGCAVGGTVLLAGVLVSVWKYFFKPKIASSQSVS
jgi:hypothetical protein